MLDLIAKLEAATAGSREPWKPILMSKISAAMMLVAAMQMDLERQFRGRASKGE